MKARLAAVASLLLLAACATGERLSAAGDVHALLIAVRDDDRAAFDAHIDRPALEAQIQARIVDRAARGKGAARGLGVLFSGTLAHAAGNMVLRPDVFRAVAEYYGYKPGTPIPGVITLAEVLRPLPDGRVCAARGRAGPCLLTFADEGGVWRLVDFGDPTMLRAR